MLRAWIVATFFLLGCGGAEAPEVRQPLSTTDSSDRAVDVAAAPELPAWEEPPPVTEPEVYPAADLLPVSADEGAKLYSKKIRIAGGLTDGWVYMTYFEYFDTYGYCAAVRKDSLWRRFAQHPLFEKVVPGAEFYVTPENLLVASVGDSLYIMGRDFNYLLEDCGGEFLPEEMPGWARLDGLLELVRYNLHGGLYVRDIPPDPVLPEVEVTRVVYVKVPPDVKGNPDHIPPGYPYSAWVHWRVHGVLDSTSVLTRAARKDGRLRLFPRGGNLPPPRRVWD